MYFQQSRDSVTFAVQGGGYVTTPHSRYPRSELSEERHWRMGSGTHRLTATLSVDQLPPSGDIVVGQVHQTAPSGQKPRPPVELHYRNGHMYVSVLDGNSPSAGRREYQVGGYVPVGQQFSYQLQVNTDGSLDVWAAGGHTRVQLSNSFDGSSLYFKAGDYAQDTSGNSAVTFSQLDIEG
jgi:hypothetical protein